MQARDDRTVALKDNHDATLADASRGGEQVLGGRLRFGGTAILRSFGFAGQRITGSIRWRSFATVSRRISSRRSIACPPVWRWGAGHSVTPGAVVPVETRIGIDIGAGQRAA